MNTLHLIRHSRTIANDRHLFYGATDLPLSESGIALIRKSLETMRYPDIAGLRVITSGMIRTEQSLELIYGSVPHLVEPRFREMSFGILEMHTEDEVRDLPEFIAWRRCDYMETPTPGGESGNDVKARVLEALDELYDGGDTLMMCHGGVILILMEHFFPGVRKNMYEWQPEPGFGYTVCFQNGKAVSFERIPK